MSENATETTNKILATNDQDALVTWIKSLIEGSVPAGVSQDAFKKLEDSLVAVGVLVRSSDGTTYSAGIAIKTAFTLLGLINSQGGLNQSAVQQMAQNIGSAATMMEAFTQLGVFTADGTLNEDMKNLVDTQNAALEAQAALTNSVTVEDIPVPVAS